MQIKRPLKIKRIFCAKTSEKLPIEEVKVEVASPKKSFDFLFKIVITGDANTGKSHILQYLLTSEFKKVAPTIGVEFTSKVINL